MDALCRQIARGHRILEEMNVSRDDARRILDLEERVRTLQPKVDAALHMLSEITRRLADGTKEAKAG